MKNSLVNEEKYLNKNEIVKNKYYNLFEKIVILVGLIVLLLGVVLIEEYVRLMIVFGCGCFMVFVGIILLLINHKFIKQNIYMIIKKEEDEKLLEEILKLPNDDKIEIIKKLILDEKN